MLLAFMSGWQNPVAGAKAKDCIISNGVLKSYSGDSKVYKIPKKVKNIHPMADCYTISRERK